MPENVSDHIPSDLKEHALTTAEMDRARGELARIRPENWHVYACGALRFVAEEIVTGRANQYTVAAARYGLALALAANEPLDIPSDAA
jgi:hypothetical protein